MVGEHGQGAIRLLVGMVHMLDEVASEIPVLEPDGVTRLLQHPSNPSGPGAISFVKADKEVTLDGQIIGQRRGLSLQRHSNLQAERQPCSGRNLFLRKDGPAWGPMPANV